MNRASVESGDWALRKSIIALGAVSALACASVDAAAQDTGPATPFSSSFYIQTGVVDLLANEIVWDGDWRLSHLIWETTAPTIVFGLNLGVHRFTIAGEFGFAFGGDSHMVDYDWLEPYVVANGPDDWTDRSIHPDTQLGHYFFGRFALGYDVVQSTYFTVNAHVGASYTDVFWNAYGGSYIYSVGGFRDTSGDFPDGELGISYRQQLPTIFGGVDINADFGTWGFGLTADVGMTIHALGTDDHWLRDLRFYDALYPGPTLLLVGRIEREFSHGVTLFAEGELFKVFEVRADTTIIDTTIPAPVDFIPDGAGADFRAIAFRIGLTINTP